MWFDRKAKNRRFQREHVLEVKLRSDQVRAQRTRIVGRLLAVLLGTIAALFVLWRGGEWAIQKLVYENEAFAVQTVEVKTDGVILPEQLRKWTGVKTSDNLLALDLTQIKRNLELIPSIENVAVERVLPHTLRVQVTERIPIAQVYALRPKTDATGYQPIVYHVDAAGYVMQPLEAKLRSEPISAAEESLPVLMGVSGQDLHPGRPVESVQTKAALRLIAEFDRSPMTAVADLKYIDVSAPEVLRVTTGQGNEVIFGLDQMDWQLRRWRTVHDNGQRFGLAITTIDLSVTNNIPARLASVGAATPPPPKKSQPSRTRKKNV